MATLICKDGLLLAYIGYTDRWKSSNDVHEGYLIEERCTCDRNRRQTRLKSRHICRDMKAWLTKVKWDLSGTLEQSIHQKTLNCRVNMTVDPFFCKYWYWERQW